MNKTNKDLRIKILKPSHYHKIWNPALKLKLSVDFQCIPLLVFTHAISGIHSMKTSTLQICGHCNEIGTSKINDYFGCIIVVNPY